MFTYSKTGYTMYHYLFHALNTSLSNREREGERDGGISFVTFRPESYVRRRSQRERGICIE